MKRSRLVAVVVNTFLSGGNYVLLLLEWNWFSFWAVVLGIFVAGWAFSGLWRDAR